jgi:hypothetical protein
MSPFRSSMTAGFSGNGTTFRGFLSTSGVFDEEFFCRFESFGLSGSSVALRFASESVSIWQQGFYGQLTVICDGDHLEQRSLDDI